jgi:putative ABC transport system ATP-binding protein
VNGAIVEARAVAKTYAMAAGPVDAVRDVTLEVARGEYVALSGPSGCGKSTLLHLLGCVDTPSAGEIWLEGRAASSLGDDERSRLRLLRIGFVFQRFYLLPMLSAFENVEMVMAEAGQPRAFRRDRTAELLAYVGLADRAGHRPSQLSGGEMQRVAVARALANQPALILADEPTGELDEQTGEHIAELFDRLHADGVTLVVVTHNPALAARASRQLRMRSGRLL